MGQLLQFPNGAPVPVPAIIAAKGVAPAIPQASPVRPIRPSVRVARKNPQRDQAAIMVAKMAQSFGEQMAGIAQKLPRNNLRCIVSTLDERRDFDLRCAEVEIAQARLQLAQQERRRVGVLEGEVWWDSPTQSAMVKEGNRLFDLYRDAVLLMAETPARTWPQLERKSRLIGKVWLSAKSDWSDRLRAGVETDRAWLSANCPKKGRAR